MPQLTADRQRKLCSAPVHSWLLPGPAEGRHWLQEMLTLKLQSPCELSSPTSEVSLPGLQIYHISDENLFLRKQLCTLFSLGGRRRGKALVFLGFNCLQVLHPSRKPAASISRKRCACAQHAVVSWQALQFLNFLHTLPHLPSLCPALAFYPSSGSRTTLPLHTAHAAGFCPEGVLPTCNIHKPAADPPLFN